MTDMVQETRGNSPILRIAIIGLFGLAGAAIGIVFYRTVANAPNFITGSMNHLEAWKLVTAGLFGFAFSALVAWPFIDLADAVFNFGDRYSLRLLFLTTTIICLLLALAVFVLNHTTRR